MCVFFGGGAGVIQCILSVSFLLVILEIEILKFGILCFQQVNFVGKLLGPQGSTIKRLQEETGAKISVLGKGSMRDKNKVCVEFCFFFNYKSAVLSNGSCSIFFLYMFVY